MRPSRPQNGGNGAPVESVGSALDALLAGRMAPRVVTRSTPGLGDFGLRLLSAGEEDEVQIALGVWLRRLSVEHGVTPDLLAVTNQLVTARMEVRLALSHAVRNPADHTVPFGSYEAWTRLDEHEIGEVWDLYTSLVAERDPLNRPLAQDEIAEINEAIKKKATTLLYSFGARKLAAYVTTLDAPPSS